MALISKRRYRGVVRSPRGGPDRDGLRKLGRRRRRRRRERGDRAPSTVRPTRRSATSRARRSASTRRSSRPRTARTQTRTSRSRSAPASRSSTRAPRSSRRSCRCASRPATPPTSRTSRSPACSRPLVDHRARSSRPRRRSSPTSTRTCPTGRPTAPSTARSTRAPLGANVKSFVWYSPQAFKDNGYEVPTTLGRAARAHRQDRRGQPRRRVKPWCAGIESGDATGWPATDWIEDVMLRTAGPETYDKWVNHEIPFNDPAVADGARRGRQDPQERQVRQRRPRRRQDHRLDVLPGRRPADPRRHLLHAPPGDLLRGQLAGGHQGRRGRRRLRVLPAGQGRQHASRCSAVASSSRPSPTVPRSRRSRPTSPRRSGPTSGQDLRRRRLGERQQERRPERCSPTRSTSSRPRSLTDKAATFRFDGSDLMPGAVGCGHVLEGHDRLDHRPGRQDDARQHRAVLADS